jgi:hypothetical protein
VGLRSVFKGSWDRAEPTRKLLIRWHCQLSSILIRHESDLHRWINYAEILRASFVGSHGPPSLEAGLFRSVRLPRRFAACQ